MIYSVNSKSNQRLENRMLCLLFLRNIIETAVCKIFICFCYHNLLKTYVYCALTIFSLIFKTFLLKVYTFSIENSSLYFCRLWPSACSFFQLNSVEIFIFYVSIFVVFDEHCFVFNTKNMKIKKWCYIHAFCYLLFSQLQFPVDIYLI